MTTVIIRWTRADIERFKARDTKRGRRWPGKGYGCFAGVLVTREHGLH